MKDPYLVLDVPEDASQEDIRRAYLEKIHACPPERAPEAFQEISAAFKLIGDTISRARLRTFGLSLAERPLRLEEMLPRPENRRIRVGIDAWMKVNAEQQ